MSRKFNVGDKVRIKRDGGGHVRAGDIAEIICVHTDNTCQVRVGYLEKWVYNKDLELVTPNEGYANHLLSRIYEESIANGIAKVGGEIIPIIPRTLMEELENYLTKEEGGWE